MNLDLEGLERLAALTRFRANTLEKVIRLGELAADIGRHPLLSRVLALKGGTALNLMFGPPARLSVDLDFDYVGSEDRVQMQEERPEVERALETLGRGRGYRLQRSREAHAGRKIYLSYVNAAGAGDRIEVDVNYLFRMPLGALVQRGLWQPPGIPRPSVTVVSPEELFAGKLRAMLDRAMPRDLFDAIRLPGYAGPTWETPRFRRLHVALSVTLPHPLHSYRRERLERVTDREIEEQLLPTLHVAERPAAASLRDDAWRVVSPLVAVDEAEREYIERAHAGELCPELLFPVGDAMTERLRRHPALLWKIRNVRTFRPRGP